MSQNDPTTPAAAISLRSLWVRTVTVTAYTHIGTDSVLFVQVAKVLEALLWALARERVSCSSCSRSWTDTLCGTTLRLLVTLAILFAVGQLLWMSTVWHNSGRLSAVSIRLTGAESLLQRGTPLTPAVTLCSPTSSAHHRPLVMENIPHLL